MSVVTINRSELVAALEQVKGAVAQKGFVPILQHVLISGSEVFGYDSEVGIKAKLTANVQPAFNVRAQTFLDLVKALTDEDVKLTITTDKIRVECGGHKSTLAQIVEEYPKPVVKLTADAWRPVPAGFKEAVERAAIAVSTNENNKILSGLCVNGKHVYGGDGQRAVRCTLDKLEAPRILLSSKAVQELIRLGNPNRLAVAEGVAIFDYGNLTFLARLREAAAYPCEQFDTLFKDKTPVAIPPGLSSALVRLALLNSRDVKHCAFKFQPLGLEVSTRGETSEGHEMLPPVPGPWSEQGMNAAYAIPFLEFASSWQPAKALQEPAYFCGETAGFEAALAQSRDIG